jgi:hypothetical protein
MSTGNDFYAVDIAVGMDGEIWVVDTNRRAFHRTGITKWNNQGNGWEQADANLIHIDAGDC